MAPLPSSGNRGKRKRCLEAAVDVALPPSKRATPPPQPAGKRVKRKREVKIEPEAAAPPTKRAALTRKNLKAHTKTMADTDQTPSHRVRSNLYSTSGNTTTTSSNFGPELGKCGVIYALSKAKAPQDQAQIECCLNRELPSRRLEHKEWDDFRTEMDMAVNEVSLRDIAWHTFGADKKIRDYPKLGDVNWSEAKKCTPLFGKLSNPKPDLAQYFPVTLYPVRAAECLGGLLMPESRQQLAMPCFVFEAKSKEKGVEAAMLQCAYNGAVMTQAHRQIIALAQGRLPELGITECLSCAFNGDSFKIFAHHARQGPNGLEYHCTIIFSGLPNDTLAGFKACVTAFQNAQEWAKARSEREIQLLWDYDRGLAVSTHQDGLTTIESQQTGAIGPATTRAEDVACIPEAPVARTTRAGSRRKSKKPRNNAKNPTSTIEPLAPVTAALLPTGTIAVTAVALTPPPSQPSGGRRALKRNRRSTIEA